MSKWLKKFWQKYHQLKAQLRERLPYKNNELHRSVLNIKKHLEKKLKFETSFNMQIIS